MRPVQVFVFYHNTIYLYKTTSIMSRIIFKVYFLLNAEVLHGNSAVFSILHSLIRLITSARNFPRTTSQELYRRGP